MNDKKDRAAAPLCTPHQRLRMARAQSSSSERQTKCGVATRPSRNRRATSPRRVPLPTPPKHSPLSSQAQHPSTLTLPFIPGVRGAIPIIFDVLCSHDGVVRHHESRESHSAVLVGAFRPVPSHHKTLYRTFCASSFSYSVVGLAMLLHFNRRLPDVLHAASPLPLDAYATLLVAQGPISWWADVWSRTICCSPSSVAYLIDRAFASSLTLYTFYLGLACWAPHSSHGQRRLAAMTLFGLVPFTASQRALRLEWFETFMAHHIGWHVSIPLVAVVWMHIATIMA